MTRGNNRHIVFHDAFDYKIYLSLFARLKSLHPFELYHYCIMPNHTHFLVQLEQATDFSVFMKKLNLSYFHHYRRRYGWIGHFWQDRYKTQPVEEDAYFIQCGKYIELNPIRAGLVYRPEDYHYSSYRYYALGEPNALLTPDFIYNDLDKTSLVRRDYYQKLICDEVSLMR